MLSQLPAIDQLLKGQDVFKVQVRTNAPGCYGTVLEMKQMKILCQTFFLHCHGIKSLKNCVERLEAKSLSILAKHELMTGISKKFKRKIRGSCGPFAMDTKLNKQMPKARRCKETKQ